MKPGFYTILAAQFCSSLADNALLIAAISLLAFGQSPEWMTPLLKLFFVVSYVLLAPFVGAFADTLPKGQVMLITNTIKMVGCGMMFLGLHPLWSYAVVGLGAAAYSPAKYGILTELLPHHKLVAANGWIEGLTVMSIILGTLLGGALITPAVGHFLLQFDFPGVSFHFVTAAQPAVVVIMFIYLLAAIFNTFIPNTGVKYAPQLQHPIRMTQQFFGCVSQLWRDHLGQISLAVTTLFWGAGATLQFIVLKWAEQSLGLPLNQGAMLQGICAVGVALGAGLAARYIPLKKAMRVLPLGVAMGMACIAMVWVDSKTEAIALIVFVGALSGFFVVPMNALLQHRGHVLMSAGRSIAIQNFNENISVLSMLAVYTILIHLHIHIHHIIALFGALVMLTMLAVMLWHRHNQKHHNVEARIGEETPTGVQTLCEPNQQNQAPNT